MSVCDLCNYVTNPLEKLVCQTKCEQVKGCPITLDAAYQAGNALLTGVRISDITSIVKGLLMYTYLFLAIPVVMLLLFLAYLAKVPGLLIFLFALIIIIVFLLFATIYINISEHQTTSQLSKIISIVDNNSGKAGLTYLQALDSATIRCPPS